MKIVRVIILLGILAVVVLLAMTNPSKQDFERATGTSEFQITNCLIFSLCYPKGSDSMAFGILGHVYY